MKDYSFYKRAIELDKKNAGKYYQERALLHFLDMEYALSWEDFQKAAELGVKVEKNLNYQILECSKNSIDFDNQTVFFGDTFSDLVSRYIDYYIVQNRYSDALTFVSYLLDNATDDSLYIKKTQKILFHMQRSRFKTIIKRTPKFEKVYLWRINLYSENFKNFSDFEKRYYRQKINQDFETVEKISRNPEHICLLRAKYFENLNEKRYAIKFCKKAIDIAKSKNNEAFVYLSLIVLKILYIQNYDFDKALDVSIMLVEAKPIPQNLAKETSSFHYLSSLLPYSFPPEFEKYKSDKAIKKDLKKRKKIKISEMIKRVRKWSRRKGRKNAKNNDRQ